MVTEGSTETQDNFKKFCAAHSRKPELHVERNTHPFKIYLS